MSDGDEPAAGDPEDRGPAVANDDAVGDHGEGAENRGHAAAEEPNQDSADSDDDDDALTQALMSGTMDELDENGEAKVESSKPKKSAAKAEPDAEKAEETAEDEPKGTEGDEKKPDEPGPDDLSETDLELLSKARTKGQRKDLEHLFKERSELRKQATEAKQAKEFADGVLEHAKAAGIRSNDDLATLIEEHKFLNTAPKEKAAEYLRKLADHYAPTAPAPSLTLEPAAVDDAVAAGFFTKEQGDALKGLTAASKKAPEAKKEPVADAPNPVAAAKALEQSQAHAALTEIAALSTGYQKSLGTGFKAVAAEVQKRLNERMDDLRPSAWPKEAKRVFDQVIAERKKASVKTPNKSITPRGAAPRASDDDVPSEEEEREMLQRGRL